MHFTVSLLFQRLRSSNEKLLCCCCLNCIFSVRSSEGKIKQREGERGESSIVSQWYLSVDRWPASSGSVLLPLCSHPAARRCDTSWADPPVRKKGEKGEEAAAQWRNPPPPPPHQNEEKRRRRGRGGTASLTSNLYTLHSTASSLVKFLW